jgi:hypothetical protein
VQDARATKGSLLTKNQGWFQTKDVATTTTQGPEKKGKRFLGRRRLKMVWISEKI